MAKVLVKKIALLKKIFRNTVKLVGLTKTRNGDFILDGAGKNKYQNRNVVQNKPAHRAEARRTYLRQTRRGNAHGGDAQSIGIIIDNPHTPIERKSDCN